MPYLPPRSLREDSDFSHPGFPIPLVIFLSIAGVFILCVVATCVYSYNYRKKLWSGYYSGRPLPRGTRMASTKGSQEDSSYLLSAPPPYPGVEDFERHHHRSHSPGFGHGHHGYGGGDGGGDTGGFGGGHHHGGGHGGDSGFDGSAAARMSSSGAGGMGSSLDTGGGGTTSTSD